MAITRGDPNSFYATSVRKFERMMIRDALLFTNGSVSEAAKILGVSTQLIRNKAKELGGIWDNDPAIEPYVFMRDRHAKREISNPTVGGQPTDQSEPTDPSERETDGDDAVEAGDDGEGADA